MSRYHTDTSEKNTGFPHAVNVGIRHAKTPFVLLLNNDTVVHPGFTKALEEAISGHKDAFSVSAKMLSMKEEGIMDNAGDLYCALGWAFARGKDRPAEDYNKPCEIFSACGGAAIYRKSVFEKSDILMTAILPIWRTWISDGVQRFTDTAISMSRKRRCSMPEALPAAPVTMPLRSAFPRQTVWQLSERICRFCRLS